jgi:hypothetical protein
MNMLMSVMMAAMLNQRRARKRGNATVRSDLACLMRLLASST